MLNDPATSTLLMNSLRLPIDPTHRISFKFDNVEKLHKLCKLDYIE